MATDTDLERRWGAEYRRDMIPALAGYLIILPIALAVVGEEVSGLGEWALLMAPTLPALWAVRAMVRHLRRVDEYQRLLQLEALAAGFGVAMVTSVSLGLAGSRGTVPEATGWIIYGAGMLTWAAVASVQGRRR